MSVTQDFTPLIANLCGWRMDWNIVLPKRYFLWASQGIPNYSMVETIDLRTIVHDLVDNAGQID